ncbi:BT_3987 domain-containing protein [Pontibacter vulgaris]|uniref:BT_3987 domain-containing protein n=1 Tax=Pontibacter vulgaris TaxID=2905679 RepID=UPI001FA7B87D|nr:DUF1735 domain-containing protein [Pontibacter vulgaris]
MKTFTKLYALAFLAIGLTSCLDDKEIEDQKYGMINLDAKQIIEIPARSKAVSLDIKDATVTLDFVTIHLAANEVAKEDIKVTLSIDKTQAMVSKYNTDNKATVAVLPSNLYSFPEGLTVTIPKGSRDGVLKLATNSSKLDASNPYGIAFNIVSVDKPGYTISGNYNGLLARIAVKNAYHAKYAATGFFTHPVASASREIHHDKDMTTVNGNTSRVELGDLGGAGYFMYVRVNADNSVDVLADPTAVAGAQDVFETGENSYDPATKTFTLNYAYNVAAPRKISEKLVRK